MNVVHDLASTPLLSQATNTCLVSSRVTPAELTIGMLR